MTAGNAVKKQILLREMYFFHHKTSYEFTFSYFIYKIKLPSVRVFLASFIERFGAVATLQNSLSPLQRDKTRYIFLKRRGIYGSFFAI